MRGRSRWAIALVWLLSGAAAWAQARPAGAPDAWEFMRGKWVGEGTSELGQGAGYFTFEPGLGGKVWLRRNHSEYPGAKGAPPAVHEDLMIVYADASGDRSHAFYTDSEGHTIQYVVTFSADTKTVTFLADAQAAQPRYRLTYVLLQPGRMSIVLEMAPPDHPEAFTTIVRGVVKKV